MYRWGLKRLLDLGSATFLLVLLSIPIMIITVLVFIFIGWPVLFIQQRPGFKGRPFKIYKFRTMKSIRDNNGQQLPDEERLHPFGKFLRSLSLDELPELFNVIKGDMSLVGPRPLLMEYLSRFTPLQVQRHNVKPGITGLAQVNGRNAINWDDKFKLDLEYVRKYGFLLDLKILIITIAAVLRREGISANGQATMPKFEGSKNIHHEV